MAIKPLHGNAVRLGAHRAHRLIKDKKTRSRIVLRVESFLWSGADPDLDDQKLFLELFPDRSDLPRVAPDIHRYLRNEDQAILLTRG